MRQQLVTFYKSALVIKTEVLLLPTIYFLNIINIPFGTGDGGHRPRDKNKYSSKTSNSAAHLN